MVIEIAANTIPEDFAKITQFLIFTGIGACYSSDHPFRSLLGEEFFGSFQATSGCSNTRMLRVIKRLSRSWPRSVRKKYLTAGTGLGGEQFTTNNSRTRQSVKRTVDAVFVCIDRVLAHFVDGAFHLIRICLALGEQEQQPEASAAPFCSFLSHCASRFR